MSSNEPRDNELGSALNALPMPEENDNFFDELKLRMDAEPSVAPEASRRTHSRRFRTYFLPAIGSSVAAAVVAGVLVTANIDSSDESEPIAQPPSTSTPTSAPPTSAAPEEVIDAATIASRVSQAMTDLTAVKFDLVETFYPYLGMEGEPSVRRGTILMAPDGNFRRTAQSNFQRSEASYNSSTKEFRQFSDGAGRKQGTIETGSPGGWVWDNSLMGGIIGMLRSGHPDATVEKTTHEGRDAWKLSFPQIESQATSTPTSMVVIADRSTNFPLLVDARQGGKPRFSLTFSNVQLNPSTSGTNFTLEFPAGMEIERVKSIARIVTFGETKSLAGRTALRPAYIPAGFSPAPVTFAEQVDGMGGSATNVVNMSYRKGLATITAITGRDIQADGFHYDPWAGDTESDTATKYTVNAGYFAESTATLITDPLSSPYILGEKNGISFGIKGDVSIDELKQIVGSFTPES
jgi:hypothetical protein